MKRYNKINLKFILLGIIAPLLLFAVAYGGVFAYFTARTRSVSSTLTIGAIKISLGDGLTSSIVNSEKETVTVPNLLPGAEIILSGTVSNIGDSKAYAILVVTSEVKLARESAFRTLESKMFTAEGVEIQGSVGAYTTAATVIDVQKNANFTLKFPFDWSYNDDYQGAAIKITVYARAIQFANLNDGVQATNLLAEL